MIHPQPTQMLLLLTESGHPRRPDHTIVRAPCRTWNAVLLKRIARALGWRRQRRIAGGRRMDAPAPRHPADTRVRRANGGGRIGKDVPLSRAVRQSQARNACDPGPTPSRSHGRAPHRHAWARLRRS